MMRAIGWCTLLLPAIASRRGLREIATPAAARRRSRQDRAVHCLATGTTGIANAAAAASGRARVGRCI